MGLVLVVLVYINKYDSVVDVMEPDEVDRVQTGWVCTVEGTTTVVVVAVVSTPRNDEQTTQFMVPMHDEINRIWFYASSTLHGRTISVMFAFF